MGKILTVHHHGIEKKFHYDGFEINSERNFGKLAIKYKLGLRLFSFFTQNIWCVVHSAICLLQGLRKRKMNKVMQDGKYIAS